VSKKPHRLFTYIFASMFVLINGVQVNAIIFGQEIIVASSSANAPVNENLQKLFAVMITTFVCQLQAYSRFIYVRIGNTLAALKVTALLFIALWNSSPYWSSETRRSRNSNDIWKGKSYQ
jgi:hypothetical protein